MNSAILETATVESTVRNKTAQPMATKSSPKQKQAFVFVLELHDGRFVIGQAANACRRISAFNSGLTPGFPKPLMVKRIVGIKDRTEDRCIISTYKRFADQCGADNVIAVYVTTNAKRLLHKSPLNLTLTMNDLWLTYKARIGY